MLKIYRQGESPKEHISSMSMVNLASQVGKLRLWGGDRDRGVE